MGPPGRASRTCSSGKDNIHWPPTGASKVTYPLLLNSSNGVVTSSALVPNHLGSYLGSGVCLLCCAALGRLLNFSELGFWDRKHFVEANNTLF